MRNTKGDLKLALTIAGSDSGGGAGVQADLKTFFAHGLYGMTVITSITAQNTLGVYGIHDISSEMVELQLKAIFEDLPPHVVKIGMLSNAGIIECVSDFLKGVNFEKIVLDPVMVAKGGASLLRREALEALKNKLIPISMIITPNIYEAEVLTDRKIRILDDMRVAAKMLVEEYGCRAVVVKGGHLEGDPIDVLYDGRDFYEIPGERIVTRNTHGTGCTFASALASNLALGFDLVKSVYRAKRYVMGAIKNAQPIGKGFGPTNHLWNVFVNIDY
ncbi:MAG: bifunctional hydroxymethylpyrimidine kinase/phosphomethylpyrimidine kinase [Thermosulfidibacteraceae bacterium]|jgi:hydroxymethylpyrimidine/phosphomethylpyrimidine kinase